MNIELQISIASFAASPFSVLCHTGKNWRNKERKNEPSFVLFFFVPPLFTVFYY